MWLLNLCKRIVSDLNGIGIFPNDDEDVKSSKNLMVWLATLMSIGGMVWGTLLASFQLTSQATIPFGYVILSIVNVRYLQLTNHYRIAFNFQIFISLLLPFLLQWYLGGFLASGVVMLWSTLALIGSITMHRGKIAYTWLALYVLLALVSFVIDPFLTKYIPPILTYQTSLALLLINVIMIFGIIFFLAKVRTDKDGFLQKELLGAYKKLKTAKDEVDESNMLKNVFLGNLSHEVRTPLQGIQGMTELLEMASTKEEDKKKYIDIIKRRTSDLQNIIEALLDLASLENGEIKAFPVKRNLFDAIESAYRENLIIHANALMSKPIKMVLNNQLQSTDLVFVDPKHLTQVIINLIGNAIKYTNEGQVTVTAKKDKANYIIQVIDTGIGISSDKIDHVFKPFRQAHEGLSRSKGGIGLGLSICKKMTELWKGNLHVQSSPSVGSVFSFTIPVEGQ
jgi:signal transduction histidine kinase